MLFLNNFGRKSISLSWFVSYIVIIAAATVLNIYTYHVAEERVFRQINAVNSEVLERRRVQLDNLQKDISDLATELSRDERVRALMDDTSVTSKYIYDMIYVKEYITTWENLENDIERVFIYFKDTDYIVDSSIAQKSNFYHKLYYGNKVMSAEEFKALLSEETTGKYTRIPNKEQETVNADVLYTFSIFSTDLFAPKATIAVELASDTLLETENEETYIGEVCILDRDNKIFLSNSDDTDILQAEITAALENYNTDGAYLEGDKAILFTQSLQNDWKYLSITEKGEYLKELSSIRMLTIVMIFIYIVIGISLALYMTMKNRKPLLEIVEQLSKEKKEALKKEDGNELAYINRCIVDLLEKREEQNNKIKIQSLVVKDAVFNELLRHETLSEVSLEELLSSVGVSLNEKYLTVVMFHTDTSGLFFEETSESEEDEKLAQLIISNILSEILNPDMTPVFCNLNDSFICIINSSRSDFAGEIKTALLKTMDFVRSNFNLSFVAGKSLTHEGYDGLRQCYDEAAECMEYKFFVKYDVIEYDVIKESSTCLYYFPIEKEIQMISSLKSGDYEGSLKILHQIFDENLNQVKPQIQMAKCLVYDILGSVMKVLNDIGELDGDNIFEHFHVFERIDGCTTVIDIKNEFIDIFKEICEKSIAESIEKSKRITEKIKEFIDVYYNDPNLSGAMIADRFKVNQSYLSTLFKKYTQEGLLEYIIKVRMSRARQLLAETEETVEKISENVGYINVRTFRRTFKKIYGVTPSKYRETAAER